MSPMAIARAARRHLERSLQSMAWAYRDRSRAAPSQAPTPHGFGFLATMVTSVLATYAAFEQIGALPCWLSRGLAVVTAAVAAGLAFRIVMATTGDDAARHYLHPGWQRQIAKLMGPLATVLAFGSAVWLGRWTSTPLVQPLLLHLEGATHREVVIECRTMLRECRATTTTDTHGVAAAMFDDGCEPRLGCLSVQIADCTPAAVAVNELTPARVSENAFHGGLEIWELSVACPPGE